jgi:hypothetical protein
MMTVVIAGEQKIVIGTNIMLPRVGAWVANLIVNGETIPKGAMVATLSGVDMPCWIQRCELVQGMQHLRVIGGAGGLAKTAKAKHYRNPTVRHVLTDLARDAGETLSSTCTAAILNQPLNYWTTLALPTGVLLQALADVAGGGCLWRILYNGSLWFGTETWPACPADVRIMQQDAPNASQVLGTDAQGIWPGTTIAGRRVDLVVHDLGDPPRSTVWFAESHA